MTRFMLFLLMLVPLLSYAGNDDQVYIRIATGSLYGGSYLAAQKMAIEISSTPQAQTKNSPAKLGIIAAAQSFDDFYDALNALIQNEVESAIIPAEFIFDALRNRYTYRRPYNGMNDITVISPALPLVGYFVVSDKIKKMDKQSLAGKKFGAPQTGTLGEVFFHNIMKFLNLDGHEYETINGNFEDMFELFANGSIDGFWLLDTEEMYGLKAFLKKHNANILPINQRLFQTLKREFPSINLIKMSKNFNEISAISLPLVWVTKSNFSFQIIDQIIPILANNKNIDLGFDDVIDDDLSIRTGKRQFHLPYHPAIDSYRHSVNPNLQNTWLKSIQTPK